MANIFIIWDNIDIANKAKATLSTQYPRDLFIVGGESNLRLTITEDVLSEMDSSDFAICIITKSNYSVNLFYELGYLTSLLRASYKILVFLLNLRRQDLPIDIRGNRSFEINNLSEFDEVILREFESSKIQAETNYINTYIDIFNNWHGTKVCLKNFVHERIKINIQKLQDYIIHSTISSYFHNKTELEELIMICRSVPNKENNKSLYSLKNFMELIALHYNISSNFSPFPLTISQDENIWFRFYVSLYNGLQAITMTKEGKNKRIDLLNDSIKYLNEAEQLINYIDQSTTSDSSQSSFYISLLKGFLYNNFAASYWYRDIINNSNGNSELIQKNFEKSIECRVDALVTYDRQEKTEQSCVIHDALEYELYWCVLRQMEHNKKKNGVSPNLASLKAIKDKITNIRHRNLLLEYLDNLFEKRI